MSSTPLNIVKLDDLLEGFAHNSGEYTIDKANNTVVDVSGVCLDTRLIASGDIYLAMEGATTHGMQFANAALEKGAVAIVVDDAGIENYADALQAMVAKGIAVVQVSELKRHAGAIAARFYQHPSKAVQVVAVTGTDGKTSVCRFVADALNGSGNSCGYIGTLGWGMKTLAETQLTTPDAVTLQRMMASLRDDGANVIALEASSHGLEEGRLDAVNIDVAVLTNFGRDHLDYHESLAAYRAAKARLFSWPSLHHVVVNGNDEMGKEIAAKASCDSVVFFAKDTPTNSTTAASAAITVEATKLDLHDDGLRFEIIDNGERFNLSSTLMGAFNVENLLACHGALRALGRSANDASVSLDAIQSVPGRIEKFSAASKPTAIVDYAHTPQALSAVIASIREHCTGALWVVFGCGGDRDAGKRGPMGMAAEQADHIVVTDDNPRTEDSRSILDQIVAGMSQPERAVVIADRGAAIAHALTHAANNDLVLVAGKGHEAYQIVGKEKRDFSDRDVVQQFMREAV